MVADAKGRNLDDVFIPVDGSVAYAPVDPANAIANLLLADPELGSTGKELPEAFKFLGLRTSDGGVEETREAGEAIEFFEQGFQMSSDGTVGITMTLAQWSAITREFVHGEAPDVNGVIGVDFSVRSEPFILFVETIAKDGRRQRKLGVARLSEATDAKEERGTVKGITVVCNWQPHDLFGNVAYQLAMLPAPVVTVP